ncbi:MAG TPA: hydroxyacid-oxoacid transhydrogenase [Acidimicrobiales bacterium]|nr:hydroxyacid-oxoacid transhydrogenase [Acidimicrobiales bacterium]
MEPYHTPYETIFTWGAPAVKFGLGASFEIGHDVSAMGVERVCVVTDPDLATTGLPEQVQKSLVASDVQAELYDQAHVEPTDDSLRAAVAWARGSEWDAFVAVGGGSSIDTAKAMNLLSTNPGDLLEYVNKPIGEGRAPERPLKPLVAVPTTAGTGSESTPVCVLDLLGLKVKSGISHPRLRPTLAVIDPLTTLTMPPEVTAATGMDVLCHALESYTAKPYNARPRVATPGARVAYCGANPISDLWSEKALALLGTSFRQAVHNGDDVEARTNMMAAATYAGIGFGNAGVTIPHACAYPIAGMVRSYRPRGYPEEALVPHGQSVAVTAPSAFRYTYVANRDRHLQGAALLAGSRRREIQSLGQEAVPKVVTELMRDIGVPSGLAELGYGEGDIDELVAGTLKQQRILVGSPRRVTDEALAHIFAESMANW